MRSLRNGEPASGPLHGLWRSDGGGGTNGNHSLGIVGVGSRNVQVDVTRRDAARHNQIDLIAASDRGLRTSEAHHGRLSADGSGELRGSVPGRIDSAHAGEIDQQSLARVGGTGGRHHSVVGVLNRGQSQTVKDAGRRLADVVGDGVGCARAVRHLNSGGRGSDAERNYRVDLPGRDKVNGCRTSVYQNLNASQRGGQRAIGLGLGGEIGAENRDQFARRPTGREGREAAGVHDTSWININTLSGRLRLLHQNLDSEARILEKADAEYAASAESILSK